MTPPRTKVPIPFSRRRGIFAGASGSSWHALLIQNPISRKHLDMDAIESELLAEKFAVSCDRNVPTDLFGGRLATPCGPWMLLAKLGAHRWLYGLIETYSPPAALALASAGGLRVMGAERLDPTGVVELIGYHGRALTLHYRVAPNERSFPAGFHGSLPDAPGHAIYDGALFPQAWWKKSANGLSTAANHLAEYSAYAAGVTVRNAGGTIGLVVLPGEVIDQRSFARIDMLRLEPAARAEPIRS